MLTQIADGVHIHVSDFLHSNSVVVQGAAGVLLIDPGVTVSEITCLARDLRELGQPIVTGFATHPHWDHLLWHVELGTGARHGTARCADDAAAFLSSPTWQEDLAGMLPPEVPSEAVALDLLGRVAGIPTGADRIPWDGPTIRIVEHNGHAAGHAGLWIEDAGVLVAGDMLSDELIPLLDMEGADPVGDYLEGLRRLERVASSAQVVVPGHGLIGRGRAGRARIELDRAYVVGLRDGTEVGDPRLQPSAVNGSWLPDVHSWQAGQFGPRRDGAATPN